MTLTAPPADRISVLLPERLVRYGDLRPCTTAFIDTRTPGSKQKENFTIIGPGVAENPDQHVHIDIPHGFNIGGARQPPGCINSQHSHETAEVFVVHSGTWAFTLGPNCEDGEVVLGVGDTISIPVHVFRGFRNVGRDTGFLFAVLGGDDPGHVTWAPYVFDDADRHGLILLEDGSLVDTTKGETVPPSKRPMRPTTDADVARLRRMSADELAKCVVRRDELPSIGSGGLPGIDERPIIGEESAPEGLAPGRMDWPHGFHLRHFAIEPGAASELHRRAEEEVIMMHRGRLTLTLGGGTVELGPGDVLTVPVGMARKFENRGAADVEAYVVRGGDCPAAPSV